MDESKCPECGVALPEGLETCPHCGASVPQRRRPTPPPAAPTMPPAIAGEMPDLNALVEAGSRPGRRVQRRVTAEVKLDIAQAAVDKEGLLTPEQWARLLQGWDEALEAHLKARLEQGEMSIPTDTSGVAVPWERVGDSLTSEQRAGIEAELRGLFAQLPGTPLATSHADLNVRQEIVRKPPRAGGCGLVAAGLLLAIAGLILHLG